MNIYESLISGGAGDPSQTKALAARLRGEDDRSTLAMLSGDSVLGAVGATQRKSTAAKTEGLRKTREAYEKERRLKEQGDASQAALKNYYEGVIKNQADKNVEEIRWHDMQEGIKEQTATLAQQKADEKMAFRNRSEARKLAFKLQDEGIVDLETAFQQADLIVAKYFNPHTGERKKGVTDIPGYGGVDNMKHMVLLSQEGKELRTYLARVRNIVLKARSGAAVTDPEMKRFAEELGTAIGGTEEQMIMAYVNLRKGLDRVKNNIMAPFSDEVQNMYFTGMSREERNNPYPGSQASYERHGSGGTSTQTRRGTEIKVIP